MDKIGRIFLVGAGPGDPDLLTMKAHRLITTAEVVVFDRLVSDDILNLIPPGTTRIYAGKAPNAHHMIQDDTNDLLVNLATKGHDVVRLKGGDPYIFGRGSEEAEVLSEHGIPFEVVPGITAASGAAAYAGIPLTHRGLSTGVRYVTGHFKNGEELAHDWRSLADPTCTLVIYMGLKHFPRIARELMAHGLPASTPAAAVQRASTPEQKRVVGQLGTLAEVVSEEGLTPPTLFIVGRVVEMAGKLDWFAPEAIETAEALAAETPANDEDTAAG